ncbi:MAG: starch synthase [Parvicellaceae bacterium]|jgi:starch synthase
MTMKRVLYVSQEIQPFLPETEISKTVRNAPQGIKESGKEIRIFMPRFGCINERRHQLHEVIRLSGMNLIIDDVDHPLIIKVASIQAAKMQVYFIDNEEYFKRKAVFEDEDKEKFFADNDERAIFFCRGVVETVKKLGWAPDVIHCNGWMTGVLPLYLKKFYADDPHFVDAKIVYSVYEQGFEGSLDSKMATKLKFDGFEDSDLALLKDPTFANLNKIGVEFSDAVVRGSANIDADVEAYIKASGKSALDYYGEEEMVAAYNEFYDKVLDENSVLAD